MHFVAETVPSFAAPAGFDLRQLLSNITPVSANMLQQARRRVKVSQWALEKRQSQGSGYKDQMSEETANPKSSTAAEDLLNICRANLDQAT